MKARVLEKLVENSEVLEIESDSRPFSHKDDQFPLAEREKFTQGMMGVKDLESEFNKKHKKVDKEGNDKTMKIYD